MRCHFYQFAYPHCALSSREQAEYVLVDDLFVLLLAEIWGQAEFKYLKNSMKS